MKKSLFLFFVLTVCLFAQAKARMPYSSAADVGTVTSNLTVPQPFTFDDVTGSLKDLTLNSEKYKSVFDEPFFGFLKKMHDAYGTHFSLFCFLKSGDWKLEQVTGKYAKEFQRNSSWLKFGLHQGLDSANYKNAPKGMVTRDYKYFLRCMKTIVGGDKHCIADTIRLQNFAGNLQACLELKKLGIKAFLGADDSRNSYYLNKEQSSQLVKDGSYTDKEHGLTFIRTERRLEKVSNAGEYVKRYVSPSLTPSLPLKGVGWAVCLSFFTHEYELLDKNTFELKPTLAKRIETICKFMAGPPVYGAIYHQRLDDLTWENNYCAFRAYGPALQKRGEKSYGYDIWVKNTPDTIVPLRYRLHIPPKGSGIKMKSFHQDWGNGMDCYDVGSSLGCCTAALLDKNDSIVFPWCWQKCEFLKNGPDTFKVHLTYTPVAIATLNYEPSTITPQSYYTEHRIITAIKGQRLNKCEVWYEGLTEPAKIAVGIVLHNDRPVAPPAHSGDSVMMDKKQHLIAYVDPQNRNMTAKDGSDGVIYIGAICPEAVEMKVSQGHILAVSKPMIPTSQHPFTYYFGATWSKYDIHSFQQWKELLSNQKKW